MQPVVIVAAHAAQKAMKGNSDLCSHGRLPTCAHAHSVKADTGTAPCTAERLVLNDIAHAAARWHAAGARPP
jgi:hypothetical protein